MRTTINIDDDLAARLNRIAEQRGISFRQAVNDALRQGFRRPRRAKPVLPVFACGGPMPGIDLDRALALDAALDTQAQRQKLLAGQ
jgi:methylphosphotriester-DNA--protein-cysteine methyltransferase